MLKRFIHIIVFCLFAQTSVFAEIPDTIRIMQINIIGNYLPDNTGYHLTKIDSVSMNAYKQDNLSTLLALKSPVFIKDYGPGNIASSSFRGANASHTQVLWNGININSPMLGQIDFAQISTNMIDEIVIYHGGAAVAGNSGAIGGTINIFSNPKWNTKNNVEFVQEFGSFGKSHSYFSGQIGNTKLISNTRISYNFAENNFKYKTAPYEYSSLFEQQNAAYQAKSIVEELYYRVSDRSQLSLISWFQDTYNEIPSNTNDEKQLSNSLKSTLGYQYFQTKWNVKANFAHLYNYMNYQKELIQLDSKNEVNSLISNFDFTYKFSKDVELNISNNLNYHLVESNNYSNRHERREFDNVVSFKSHISRIFTYYIGLKNQFIDIESYRFIPTIGFDVLVNPDFTFHGSYNHNYHFPTMNDLYWEYDGNAKGNPNLKPEIGYSTEIGLSYDKKYTAFEHNLSATIFYSKIQDWILWQYDFDENLINSFGFLKI